MKRKFTWLLAGMAVAGMLALAGCGSGASEQAAEIEEDLVADYVEKAHEMLEEADSFTADFRAEVQMSGQSKTVTEGNVVMVKEPLYMAVDMQMAFDDGTMETYYDEKIYLVEEEDLDGVNQYMNFNGQWTEMNMKEDSAMTSVHIYHTLYNMEAIFSAAENWTMEQDGKTWKLQGIIPEEKFYDLEEYTRWFQLTGMSGLSEVYFAGVGDVPVTVILDGKTGEPLSYEVDLAKALETVTNQVLLELSGGKASSMEITTYKITSRLTQLGGVEAGEIPAEAKDTAINYEREISLLERAE